MDLAFGRALLYAIRLVSGAYPAACACGGVGVGRTSCGRPVVTIVTMSTDGTRRTEILETAARLFATAGMRVSLKEIADACGILPGSLYHHFDSKEAIIIELVRRYRDDLDRLADEAAEDLQQPASRPVEARIIEFGQAIAACGVRHRAALLLSLYEPPAVLGDELAHLASQAPTAIEATMLEMLREGRASGAIRPGIDLTLLSDRLCQSMLHVGVGVSHMTPGEEQVPEVRLRILLDGIATRAPSNAALDRLACHPGRGEGHRGLGRGTGR